MSKEVGAGGRFDIFLDSVWSFPFSSNMHVRNVRTQKSCCYATVGKGVIRES